MTIASAPSLTLQAFLERSDIDESPVWEYCHGEMSQKPMGGGKHSLLQKMLVRVIDQLDSAYEAFPELRCTIAGRSIVPDVVVMAKGDVPVDEAGDMTSSGIEFAPPWIIEILSPKQSQTKVTGNILHCLKTGSQLAWLIDPEARSILVYQPNQLPDVWTEGDDLPALPVLSGLELSLSVQQVFQWLSR
ncbi:MAG: Uma2 family endonuclease [Merismopedia sp. SIO2A8]|nr:Uma2 family endonuclease [Symploca sp. SIO2B6]NET50138.1 Uma2 family endonuclease [Merismopedia sp. SIO2A8]